MVVDPTGEKLSEAPPTGFSTAQPRQPGFLSLTCTPSPQTLGKPYEIAAKSPTFLCTKCGAPHGGGPLKPPHPLVPKGLCSDCDKKIREELGL